MCIRMYVLRHYSALLTWIKLIGPVMSGKRIQDIEESDGKRWTTRSLSLFDSDDNVHDHKCFGFNKKIKWSRYKCIQQPFSIIAKKKKLKIIGTDKFIWIATKYFKERNSDFSGVKPSTKVQREIKWTVSENFYWRKNEFGKMAVWETLDLSEW